MWRPWESETVNEPLIHVVSSSSSSLSSTSSEEEIDVGGPRRKIKFLGADTKQVILDVFHGKQKFFTLVL